MSRESSRRPALLQSLLGCVFWELCLADVSDLLGEATMKWKESDGSAYPGIKEEGGFQRPEFSEEERYSKALPDSGEIRCDVCSIVAQNVAAAFLHAESFQSRPLKEHRVDEIIGDLCETGLDDYGVVKINDTFRFQGAGVIGGHQIYNVLTGGVWLARLKQSCKKSVGDFGDEELYVLHRRHVEVPPPGTAYKLRAQDFKDGVLNLMREFCMQEDAEEPDKSKKNKKQKKKRKRSAQDVIKSCSLDHFYFEPADFQGVLDAQSKDRQTKPEL